MSFQKISVPSKFPEPRQEHQSTDTHSKTSDYRKGLIATTIASRLAYLGDTQLQRQEMMMAIEVLAPLDDELLRKACIEATRQAGNRFVLAQHIFAAAKPELDHRADMRRIEQRQRQIEAERLALPRHRVSADRAQQIINEVMGK